MCIICNAGDAGCAYLAAVQQSRQSMQEAAKLMLACRDAASDPKVKRRYDRTHKQMRRLIGEWNGLEQSREVDPSLRVQTSNTSAACVQKTAGIEREVSFGESHAEFTFDEIRALATKGEDCPRCDSNQHRGAAVPCSDCTLVSGVAP